MFTVDVRDGEHVRMGCGRSDGSDRSVWRGGERRRIVLQHLHGHGADRRRGPAMPHRLLPVRVHLIPNERADFRHMVCPSHPPPPAICKERNSKPYDISYFKF